MKVTYEITAYDGNGHIVQQEVLEDTANVTIEDIKMNAILNNVDSIEVGVLGVKIDKDDGTLMEWNVDSE